VNVTANEATALTAAQTYTIALADAGNTTVNFTGAENVVSTISSTSLNTLNLSGLTTGTSNITATASIANMTVTGSNQNDTVSAGSGNDSIIGGTGDDDLIGGAGADTIDGGTGNDTIIGGIGTDSLIGGDGTDTISAAYTLSTDGGGSAATGVVINLSSSAILSTTIATNASLATSSDILSVASNTLVNVGTAETVSTRVDSLSGFENITGSAGTDYLIGSSSANSISGGAGADYINPGLGADTITGGAAADTIVLTETTSSSDTVVFSGATTALNGADIITGFVLAADVLSFSSLTAGSLTATITAGTMATATALATETTSIALATNKVYVAQVATAAGIDTAAEVITAIADGGVLDALDVAANATAFLIVSGADVATSAYVYGIVNDATAATAAGELVLLGTITTDSNVFTASNFSF
jgi:Ca2+-binding RTX toxin-like protein